MLVSAGVFAFVPVIRNLVPQNSLPGGTELQSLMDGLAFWALIAALAGMVVGAVLWAVGHHSANYQQSFSGRKGVIVSAAAAMVIGAAPGLINFFFGLGHGVGQ